MKHLPIMALLMLAATPAAFAQESAGPAEPQPEKVNQVIVYGEDPCPASVGDEIVVCVRSTESPYRVPSDLRTDPNDPRNDSWAARASSIEYVGRSGTRSCTPTGVGGASGCFNKIVQQARAERRANGEGTWGALVAQERARRLGNIDAESEEIERQAQAEEEAQAAAASAAAAD